LKYINKTIL